MKIDIHNYEAFFLDFVEGRLDDASTLEMLAFLRKHPDLKAELESFSDIRLESSDVIFKEKNQLRKFDFQNSHVTLNNFEDYCIAHYEKLLSSTESEKLFNFLALNPERQNDFQLYGKTYLKADASVVFEAKPFLKKRPKGVIRTVILKWTAVAAGIVLIVSVFYNAPDKQTVSIPQNVAITQTGKIVQPKRVEEKATVLKSENETPVKTDQVNVASVSSTPSISGQEEIIREDNLPFLEPLATPKIQSFEEVSAPEYILANASIKTSNIDSEEFEVLDYAEKVIREKVLKNSGEEPSRRRFSLWDLADITIKGYNHLSEKDIILHRKTNENGKLTVFAIETENKTYGFESKN